MHMKSSLALIVTLASGLALSAAAQTLPAPAPAATPAGPAKVAVIAFQVAVAQTNEGQRNFADLQKKYAPKRDHLRTMNDEIGELTKQLQTQGDKLSDEVRASKVKALEDKQKVLQREAGDAENDFKSESQEIFNGLASKVYEVLLSYAQQQGYTIVLDVSQEQNPVLFANQSTNITKAVIDAYNVKSGVPAPPAAPKPAAPKPAAQ
jgi:outer membrane protein